MEASLHQALSGAILVLKNRRVTTLKHVSRERTRCWLLSLPLLILLTLCFVIPAFATNLVLGIHMAIMFTPDQTTRHNAIDAMANIGAQIARDNVDWDVIEGTQGVYDWTLLDDTVNYYTIKGIDIILTFQGSPNWANGSTPFAVPDGSELLSNIDFETAGRGGADVFANWTESAGDGAIAQNGTIVHSGSYSCALTAGATANTLVSQTVTVVPGQMYRFHGLSTITAYGDPHARYAIYDVTHSAYLVPIKGTGYVDVFFRPVYEYFTAPAGCTSIRLELYCSATNGKVIYWDDVSIINILSSTFTTWKNNYATFISTVVNRYKDRVNKWEIGNEPNEYNNFWTPWPDIKQYTAWFNAAYDAIKTAQPTAQVCAGAICSLLYGSTEAISGVDWLQLLYTELDGNRLPDAVGLHPYCGDPAVHTDYVGNMDDIAAMRAVMTANSDTGPVWVTEFGWLGDTSPNRTLQATYLKEFVELLKSTYPYVTIACCFMGVDRPAGSYTYYGLFSYSGSTLTAKPAATTFWRILNRKDLTAIYSLLLDN